MHIIGLGNNFYRHWMTLTSLFIFIAFIIVEFLFSDLYIDRVPVRSYLLSISFCAYLLLVFRYTYLRELLTERAFLIIFTMFIIFSLLALLSYLCNNEGIVRYLTYFIKFLAQPFMIFFITYVFFVIYGHRLLLKFFIIILSVSAIVAVLQYFNIDLFCSLRFKLGLSPRSVIREVLLSRHRAVGLALYYIPLAYQLICFYPFIFYFISLNKKNANKWVAVFTIFFLGIFTSGTRSAFLGLILGVCFVYLTQRRIRKWAAFSLASILLFSIVFIGIDFSRYNSPPRIFRSDDSLFLKPRLLYSFVYTISKNILKKDTISAIKEESIGKPLRQQIKIQDAQRYHDPSSHNQFINTFLTYGIFGLIALFFYYLYIWRLCNRGLFFCKAGIISYIILSFFHNAGPFYGDYIWWHVCAFVVYSAVAAQRGGYSLSTYEEDG